MKSKFLTVDYEKRGERGEFGKLADAIAQAACDDGLTVEEINKVVMEICGTINCYPGIPTDTCYDKAVFVSIEGIAKKKYSRGHLTLDQMFAEFNRHFTMCPKTRVAVIICDTWHVPTYDHWHPIFKIIAERGVHIEFYLIWPGRTIPLPSLPVMTE